MSCISLFCAGRFVSQQSLSTPAGALQVLLSGLKALNLTWKGQIPECLPGSVALAGGESHNCQLMPSTTSAYEAKFWKGIDLLRIDGNLVCQTGGVANKTDLVIILQSQGSSSLSCSCHESLNHSRCCRVTHVLHHQAEWICERDTWHGRHRFAASLGSLSCSSQRRGKETWWILMWSPPFERSWAVRVARWKKNQPCVVWQRHKWPALAHIKLFFSLTHFLLLDVLISYNLYSATCGQVNRLFWIKQLCWLIALFNTKLKHVLG